METTSRRISSRTRKRTTNIGQRNVAPVDWCLFLEERWPMQPRNSRSPQNSSFMPAHGPPRDIACVSVHFAGNAAAMPWTRTKETNVQKKQWCIWCLENSWWMAPSRRRFELNWLVVWGLNWFVVRVWIGCCWLVRMSFGSHQTQLARANSNWFTPVELVHACPIPSFLFVRHGAPLVRLFWLPLLPCPFVAQVCIKIRPVRIFRFLHLHPIQFLFVPIVCLVDSLVVLCPSP